ncbi:hypothetical protein A0H76_1420 [Hepatospora eriocheir]|uniref:Uncharacterized protein n=1 Tax=Hepatospora eriocheir TaxID=1081669 RepID=A0A1X0QH58_9MICR|nr:hypothetical protein A0H76_1420 [Hepatospora eriocheir]
MKLNLLPNHLNINKILEREALIEVEFNENIRPTKLYTNIIDGFKGHFPISVVDFFIRNEHCKPIENDFKSMKEELNADSHIVNLRNECFYTKSLLNGLDNNPEELKSIFFERMCHFSKLLLKSDFTEDDMLILSAEEKNIILRSKQAFNKFK